MVVVVFHCLFFLNRGGQKKPTTEPASVACLRLIHSRALTNTCPVSLAMRKQTEEEKKAGQRAVFTLVRTSGAAATRKMKDPTEGEQEKNVPSCRRGPTLRTFYCLHPSVWWERPGTSRHTKRQKTAHLAPCSQPPPETDASVWPRWVEPASGWGRVTFLGGGVSARIDVTEGRPQRQTS